MRTYMRVIGCLVLLFVLCSTSPLIAETHYLDFNPNAYTSEFFIENNAQVGSCGAAAVVLVESHMKQRNSIASTAVSDMNTQVRGCTDTRKEGIYWISSLSCIKSVLENHGYVAANRTTSSRASAADRIFTALANKHWVIIIARYNFTTTDTGHFYPVYGGNLTSSTSTSTLNVIDDLYNRKIYDYPTSPNWSLMYKTQVNLDKILTSMAAASTSTTVYYNILEVYETNPPTISITSPKSGATFFRGTRYTISWSAQDSGGLGDVSVELISGSASSCKGATTVVPIRQAGSGYVTSVPWTVPTSLWGSYNLKVAVRDKMNNWGCVMIPIAIR